MWKGLIIKTTGPFRWIFDGSLGKGDLGLMVMMYHGTRLGYASVGQHCMFVYLGIGISLFKFVVAVEIARRIKT